MMQRRIRTNKERLKGFTGNLLRLDEERKRVWEKKEISNFYSLCVKSRHAYGALNGSESSGERDGRLPTLESGGLDKPISIIFGFQTGGKTSVRPVKLPRVENVPPYTAWIYLDRYRTIEKNLSSIIVAHHTTVSSLPKPNSPCLINIRICLSDNFKPGNTMKNWELPYYLQIIYKEAFKRWRIAKISVFPDRQIVCDVSLM